LRIGGFRDLGIGEFRDLGIGELNEEKMLRKGLRSRMPIHNSLPLGEAVILSRKKICFSHDRIIQTEENS